MTSDKENEPAILDVQRQRLAFLIRKSRKLETRLAELRSKDLSMELRAVNIAEDCDAIELKETKQLIDLVNKLKAEFYCLNYQTNVYNGSIPPGLIDYMPDQPVESTLSVPDIQDTRPLSQSELEIDEVSNELHRTSSSMASSNNSPTPTCTPIQTPTGNMPSTSSEALVQNEIKDPQSWSCSKCSFINHPLIDSCEICEHQRVNFSEAVSQKKSGIKCQSKCSRCPNSTCYCHLSSSKP